MSETLEQIALRVAEEVKGKHGDLNIQIVEFSRRLVAALGAQEPDGWIDGEGDPYCQHGWGKKPPKGWTTCEENSYPVFRVQKPVIQDNTALTELLAQERERVIALYSPDDTAQDWIDKIRSMK